jgi:hypothetical protein
MRRRTAALALGAALLSAAGPPLRSGERLAYTLALRIRFETASPSASLADEVASSVLAELRAKGCFREVRLAPSEGAPEADVLLELVLSEMREEVRYEQSVAERAQPLDPGTAALAYVATLSFQTSLALAALPGGDVARTGDFHVSVERRPRAVGDDARTGARMDAMRDLARKTRATLCKGSASKLAGAIEAVRRAP